MRWALWFIGLFAVAVAAALLLRADVGYVLFVLPGVRAEVSLNFFCVLLVAAFAGGYFLLRSVLGIVGLPKRVQAYREERRRSRSRDALVEAVAAYFEARFGRAEQAAVTVMESGEQAALGAVLAARAAHELRQFERRDGYLARAGSLAPEAPAARIIAQADMLLEQRRFQEALFLLKDLPEKHTAALRLELKAQQQARQWESTLPLIDKLERRSVFDAAHADELRRHVYAETLKRKALDRRALEAAWEQVPAALRRDRKIAAAAAQGYIALGGCRQAAAIIENSLEVQWDSELLEWYAECEGTDVVERIERAEAWLAQHPRDAALLLALGRLCTYQELWGKAQSYLEASIAVESGHAAHLALARLHERLGHSEEASRHYRESLALLLRRLGQAEGRGAAA